MNNIPLNNVNVCKGTNDITTDIGDNLFLAFNNINNCQFKNKKEALENVDVIIKESRIFPCSKPNKMLPCLSKPSITLTTLKIRENSG